MKLSKLDQNKEDLKKLQSVATYIKTKHQLDLKNNNVQEVEKNKRIMIAIMDKIKEKKKEIEKQSEIQEVSDKIKSDSQNKEKFFAQKSHLKYNKKIHISTLIATLLIGFYSFICIFQFKFYNHALNLQKADRQTYPLAIYNTNYMAKFIGIIILLYFLIYIINYKNMKYKIYTVILGLSGLILGILSYGGVGSLNMGFFSGEKYGIYPGIALIICTILLGQGILVVKTKKVYSLKESREFSEIKINPDELKLEAIRKIEEEKRKNN